MPEQELLSIVPGHLPLSRWIAQIEISGDHLTAPTADMVPMMSAVGDALAAVSRAVSHDAVAGAAGAGRGGSGGPLRGAAAVRAGWTGYTFGAGRLRVGARQAQRW